MKFWCFVFVLISFASLSQDFDHIQYKQDCNTAYVESVQSHDFKKSNCLLLIQQKKYGRLYTEEYMLMAYNYKKLGRDTKCAKILRKAWSTQSYDLNGFMQIEEIRLGEIISDFTKRQNKILEKGYRSFSQNKPKIGDTLQAIFTKISDSDQEVRMQRFINPSDSIKNFQEIKRIDSLNLLIFKEIVFKYGFPGEKLLPGDFGSVPLILIHSSYYEWFFTEMQPVFLNEVRLGNMSPSYYLAWIDRHNIDLGKKQQFLIFDYKIDELNESDIIQYKRNRLHYGMVESLPVPLNLLSFQE